MAVDKTYYIEKQKDIVEQVNKLVQKNTNNQYEFVKEHSELVQKYNEIAKIMKEQEKPENAVKEKDGQSKIAKPAKK